MRYREELRGVAVWPYYGRSIAQQSGGAWAHTPSDRRGSRSTMIRNHKSSLITSL